VRTLYLEELARMATEPMSDEELSKVHNQLRASIIFAQQRPLGCALSLGRNVLYHDDPDYLNRYLSAVMEVKAPQVLALIARTLDADGLVDLRVIPR